MTDVHPHWHTNEDTPVIRTEEESAVITPRAVRVPIGGSAAARSPAAVTGILLVLVLGFAAFDVLSSFETEGEHAQVAQSSSTVQIRITKDGVSPKTVDVHPGQEIVWTNEDDIPHILESETIISDKGSTLYTPAVFPNSKQNFTLAPNHTPGRHTYLSTTSVNVFGEINVIGTPVTTPAPATMESMDKESIFDEAAFMDPAVNGGPSLADPDAFEPMEPKAQANTTVKMEDGREETIDSSDPLGPESILGIPSQTPDIPDQDAAIPYNPYRVGSDLTHPYDSTGDISDGTHAGAPTYPTKGYKPFKHTDTGPALWIVSGVSIAVFLWFTRKYMKRTV